LGSLLVWAEESSVMLDRVNPKHLPVIYRIAKTRLRPFFSNPHANQENHPND
jgi:hypothetical protein